MIRPTFIILVGVLIALSTLSNRVDVAVHETRSEIAELERERDDLTGNMQLLRAEIAYLESPERLAGLAENFTELEPLAGQQLMTSDEFRVVFSSRPFPDDASEATPVAADPMDIADLIDGE
ncbi:MAG: hypothetical protein AAFR21_03405 [Pseudomonadota bacterium]